MTEPTKTWNLMNDLEDAFNEITAFNFLLDQLQEAVDAGEFQRVIDTTAALNAFYTPYCNNWDNKFKKAWEHIVKETPVELSKEDDSGLGTMYTIGS